VVGVISPTPTNKRRGPKNHEFGGAAFESHFTEGVRRRKYKPLSHEKEIQWSLNWRGEKGKAFCGVRGWNPTICHLPQELSPTKWSTKPAGEQKQLLL